jgi:hypothetical protein
MSCARPLLPSSLLPPPYHIHLISYSLFYSTQPAQLGQGIAIIIVVVVHTVGVISHCDVVQSTSATSLLIVVVVATDKSPPNKR